MSRGERIANLVLLLVLIVFLIEAQNIPPGFMVESVRREVGADFWPKTLLVALIFLTVVLNVNYLFSNQKTQTSKSLQSGKKERWWNWVLLLVSIVIYIEIQYVIGFVITCFLMIGFGMINFGYRKTVPLIIFPTTLTIIFVLVFGRFLNVPLPKGLGVFRSISMFFY
jgi:hypothetical protein